MQLAFLILLGISSAFALTDPDWNRFWNGLQEADEMELGGKPFHKIKTDYPWTEGPVWHERLDKWFFGSPLSTGTNESGNKIYSMTLDHKITVEMENAGQPPESKLSWAFEAGNNGLAVHPRDDNFLIVAQHGRRALALFDIEKKELTNLVDNYNGLKFNSPNDIAVNYDSIFFTDPPYGMLQNDSDLGKQIIEGEMDRIDRAGTRNEIWPEGGSEDPNNLPIRGVYRYDVSSKKTEMLLSDLARPNGIGLHPDGKRIFVVESCQLWTCKMTGMVHVYAIKTGKSKGLRKLKTITFKSDAEAPFCDGITFAPPNLGPYALISCWGVVAINTDTYEFVGKADVGFRTSNLFFKHSRPQALIMTGADFVATYTLDDIIDLQQPENSLFNTCADIHRIYKKDPMHGANACNAQVGCKARLIKKKMPPKFRCKAIRCRKLLDIECGLSLHCTPKMLKSEDIMLSCDKK